MLVSLYRTTKYATTHFWRNLWISLVTIFILTLTLFIVSFVATLNLVANQAIESIQEKIDIDFYFKQTVKENDVLEAKIFLESSPEVKQVRYISKAEALQSFTAEHSADQNIQDALAALDDNPLPATLSVQAYELNQYESIVDQFEASQYAVLVEQKNFSDHQLVIDRLSLLSKRAYQGGIIVSIIFVLVSIIMMYNTIRIAIYSHREELGIMKLVGATNWFIRAPFILESLLYALLASVVSLVLLAALVFSLAPYVNGFFTGYNFSLNLFFINNLWLIVIGQILFSSILAIGSSMLSIGKYLRV
ncbi:MAG: cell division protein [uncultured bacterium]|nr:MAG: cell division protein [uncultured bacterium]